MRVIQCVDFADLTPIADGFRDIDACLAYGAPRQLDAVADQHNGRARRTLYVRTPTAVFDEAVALVA